MGDIVVSDTEINEEILHFCPEDKSDTFLRNICNHLQDQNTTIDIFTAVRTSKLKEILRNANCNGDTKLTGALLNFLYKTTRNYVII